MSSGSSAAASDGAASVPEVSSVEEELIPTELAEDGGEDCVFVQQDKASQRSSAAEPERKTLEPCYFCTRRYVHSGLINSGCRLYREIAVQSLPQRSALAGTQR